MTTRLGSIQDPSRDATPDEVAALAEIFAPTFPGAVDGRRLHPEIITDQSERARRYAVDLARDGVQPASIRLMLQEAYAELTAAQLSTAIEGYVVQARDEGHAAGVESTDPPEIHVSGVVDWIASNPKAQRAIQVREVMKDIKQGGVRQLDDRMLRELAEDYVDRDAEAVKEQTPLTMTGADLIAGHGAKDETPCVARGVAYEGRAVLVHSARGCGKTTLLSWLSSRATTSGKRVLVVGDDDPASWAIRMRAFNADHSSWSYANAARLARDGALERAVADFSWIIVDNWRTWGVAAGVADRGGFGNTEAVAVAVGRLVAVVRDSKRALTIIGNEGYANTTRSRDSSVVEDAVDATRQLRVDPAARVTTLTPAKKTRVGIDELTYRWRLAEDGASMQEQGVDRGGPVVLDDVGAPVQLDPVREFAKGWLSDNPGGSWKAFRGAFRASDVQAGSARLKAAWDGLAGGCPRAGTLPGTGGDTPDSEGSRSEGCPYVPPRINRGGHPNGDTPQSPVLGGVPEAVPEGMCRACGQVPASVGWGDLEPWGDHAPIECRDCAEEMNERILAAYERRQEEARR